MGRVRKAWQLVVILVLLCFFSSMLVTNDVALITFVPFTFVVLGMIDPQAKQQLIIPIVVLQTIAANLGSMLTPIGNPQNLYLFGFFIFIGNIGRLPAFSQMLQQIVSGNEILAGVAASQVISNVPAALLLPGFTEDLSALIIREAPQINEQVLSNKRDIRSIINVRRNHSHFSKIGTASDPL